MKTCGTKVACQTLNLTESAVRYLVRAGHLSCKRDDMNRRRFKIADVKRLARKRQRQGGVHA